MRPPEHWHLRRRRSRRLWWIVALVAVVVAGAFVLRFWPSGGEGEPSTASTACPAGQPASAGEECAPASRAPSLGGGVAPPRITGKAAAAIEEACGALLYGRNAHQRLPPASLAKIATALVAVERADPSQMVEVRVNSGLLVASTASTVMGLEPGLRLSMRDLLYGLLLPSGNDAAIAIAEEVAGSVPAFVELMNEKAVELGLRNTHFANPHGLDEPGLYTSAYDAAMLGRALLAQPELAQIVATESYQPAWDGPQLWNGNALLELYPEAVGVKIGYTEKAGQTIVAATERDGRRLVVSVLGSWNRYSDAIALFEWAFAETASSCPE